MTSFAQALFCTSLTATTYAVFGVKPALVPNVILLIVAIVLMAGN